MLVCAQTLWLNWFYIRTPDDKIAKYGCMVSISINIAAIITILTVRSC